MNWFNVNLQTFSWTDSIWVFKCPYCFLSYSQRLQVYWTFSWTVSLWVFKIPCVVALYSHRLHGYLTFVWTDSIWVFRCPCSTIMSNEFQELTHWHTALPVRRGEMVHLIWAENQSAFAFMTINNSTTPTLTSYLPPYFSPYKQTLKQSLLELACQFLHIFNFNWYDQHTNPVEWRWWWRLVEWYWCDLTMSMIFNIWR